MPPEPRCATIRYLPTRAPGSSHARGARSPSRRFGVGGVFVAMSLHLSATFAYNSPTPMGDQTGKPTAEISSETRADSVGLFEVVSLASAKQRWRAAAGKLTIGSHPGNVVVLKDPTVSRFHCELSASPEGVWLTDT